jgi:hypothetical protein
MVTVLFVDQFNKQRKFKMPEVPRVGERVSWDYKPSPFVTSVTWLLPGTAYPANVPEDVQVVISL